MSSDPNKQAGNAGMGAGQGTGFPGGQGGGPSPGSFGASSPSVRFYAGDNPSGPTPFGPSFGSLAADSGLGQGGGDLLSNLGIIEGTENFDGSMDFGGTSLMSGPQDYSSMGTAFTGGQLAPGVNVNPISTYLQGQLNDQTDWGAGIGNAIFPGLGKLTSTGSIGGSIGTPGMGANGEFADPANPYQILPPPPTPGPTTSFPNMQTFSGQSSLADIFGPAAASRMQQAAAFPPLPTSATAAPVTPLTNTGVPGGGPPGSPVPPANEQFGQGRWNDLAMELGGAGQGGNFFQPPQSPDMSWLQQYEAQRAGEKLVGQVECAVPGGE